MSDGTSLTPEASLPCSHWREQWDARKAGAKQEERRKRRSILEQLKEERLKKEKTKAAKATQADVSSRARKSPTSAVDQQGSTTAASETSKKRPASDDHDLPEPKKLKVHRDTDAAEKAKVAPCSSVVLKDKNGNTIFKPLDALNNFKIPKKGDRKPAPAKVGEKKSSPVVKVPKEQSTPSKSRGPARQVIAVPKAAPKPRYGEKKRKISSLEEDTVQPKTAAPPSKSRRIMKLGTPKAKVPVMVESSAGEVTGDYAVGSGPAGQASEQQPSSDQEKAASRTPASADDNTSAPSQADRSESTLSKELSPGTITEGSTPASPGTASNVHGDECNRKRKAEDDNETAASRPTKRQNVVRRPAALKNWKNACFANAVVQALLSIPELVEKLPKTSGGSLMQELGTKAGDLQTFASTRAGRRARENLRKAAKTLHDEGKLGLTRCLVDLLQEVQQGGDKDVGPEVFLSMSGILFMDIEGNPLDGEAQEDTAGYFQTVVNHLDVENLGADISDLFKMSLDSKMVCKECKTAHILADRDFVLSTTPEQQRRGASATVSELVQHVLLDESKFEDFACPSCKGKSGWTKAEGCDTKQLSVAPKYLPVTMARQRYDKKTASLKKVNTNVHLPTQPIEIPSGNGAMARYELVAALQHVSKDDKAGHCYVVRKVDGTWFDCDDNKHGDGVQEVSIDYVQNDERAGRATLLLFKKTE